MVKKLFLWLVLAVLLVSCAPPQETGTPLPSPTRFQPTKPATASPAGTELPAGAAAPAEVQEARLFSDLLLPAPFTGAALPGERGDYFAASGVCVVCHKNMIDAAGNDVSIDQYWRGTMMANAARDPYWQAAMRAETLANPGLGDAIEDTCTRCHMPMARTTANFNGEIGIAFEGGFFNPDNPLHVLGMEGVSCTLCHQIQDQFLGQEEGFDGNYVIDTAVPAGSRVTHGPYVPSMRDTRMMQNSSGYVPQQGLHLQTSELCATCHTLYTPTVDASGQVVSEFPEQMPYEEWLNSDYADQTSCQDCHMPEVEGEVVLSVTNSPPRSPFSRHSFVGGNTYALMLLRTFGEQIGLTADSGHIDAALSRAVTQLQGETAQIAISREHIENGTLSLDVQITHQSGHKLPTGYPSRRVWVHLRVQDAEGNVVFESGNWNPDGSIIGNDNDADPLAYEPHYTRIESPDQVQIYEAIFVNTDGEVTTTLLRGNGYVKDNRLLPAGFDVQAAGVHIAVQGAAASDPDFAGGGDTVTYQIPLGEAPGPYTVTVELVYQSIAYRWAQNLAGYDAPEPQQFLNYYTQVPNLPVLIATITQEITP